jgi:hypothetical protein
MSIYCVLSMSCTHTASGVGGGILGLPPHPVAAVVPAVACPQTDSSVVGRLAANSKKLHAAVGRVQGVTVLSNDASPVLHLTLNALKASGLTRVQQCTALEAVVLAVRAPSLCAAPTLCAWVHCSRSPPHARLLVGTGRQLALLGRAAPRLRATCCCHVCRWCCCIHVYSCVGQECWPLGSRTSCPNPWSWSRPCASRFVSHVVFCVERWKQCILQRTHTPAPRSCGPIMNPLCLVTPPHPIRRRPCSLMKTLFWSSRP